MDKGERKGKKYLKRLNLERTYWFRASSIRGGMTMAIIMDRKEKEPRRKEASFIIQ